MDDLTQLMYNEGFAAKCSAANPYQDAELWKFCAWEGGYFDRWGWRVKSEGL